MQDIGVGIIGWGFMGRTHTHALRAMPLFYPGLDFRPVLASVCSRRLGKAREAAAEMGFAHHTDDYKELLAREDVRVVSICTPNALHECMALDAIRQGKHIYLDKPVATNYPAAKRIADAAREAGLVCQVALNNRFWPATMRAKQLIDEGRIGNITGFQCRYLHSGALDPHRPAGWKQLADTGVLLDLGSHALDMICHLIGPPEELLCSLRTLYAKRPAQGGGMLDELGDDQALILLRMPGGALGTVEASKIATGAEDELDFEIRGTEGALRFSLMGPNWLWFFDNRRPDVALGGERGFQRIACVGRYEAPGGTFLPPKNTVGWDRAHMHCYYSFLSAVAHSGTASPDLQEGARLQLLMDLCKQSNETGRWVRTGPIPEEESKCSR